MSIRSYLPAVLLALAGISIPLPGLAAEAVTLEEIIVTANFRDTTLLQSVGSISVVAQDTITEQAAQHLGLQRLWL